MFNEILQSKATLAVLCLTVGLAGGTKIPVDIRLFKPKVDNYGVPYVKDYMNPVVDGEPISRKDFIKKYCKYTHSETCEFISQAESEYQSATFTGWPRFGLKR